MSNAVNTTTSDEDDETVLTPEKFIDNLATDEINDVVEVLAGLDPLDVKYNAQKRDLILEARKVWQATGL